MHLTEDLARKVIVVLSMHQLLVVLAVMRERDVPLDTVDCVLLRSGAAYSEVISRIFVNAKVYVVPKFKSNTVKARVGQIRSSAMEALACFNIAGRQVELWVPNKTYHIVNYLYYYSRVVKTIAFEDGVGTYIDSGFLEYRSGIKVALKKVVALSLLFPVYRSFGGVSRIKADECWALSSMALYKEKNLIPVDSYRKSLKMVVFELNKADTYSVYEGQDLLVVVGQPLSEVGLCSDAESVEIYRQIGEGFTVINCVGKYSRVLYVPHPTENPSLADERLSAFLKTGFERTKAEVAENLFSIEVFLHGLHQHTNRLDLVGPLSTSLYTAKLVGIVDNAFYFGGPRGKIDKNLAYLFRKFGVQKIEL